MPEDKLTAGAISKLLARRGKPEFYYDPEGLWQLGTDGKYTLVEIWRMKHKEVQSSNIKSVAHDAQESVLEVLFHSGAKWRYHPVTREEFDALCGAESIGKHFHAHIKSKKNASSVGGSSGEADKQKEKDSTR